MYSRDPFNLRRKNSPPTAANLFGGRPSSTTVSSLSSAGSANASATVSRRDLSARDTIDNSSHAVRISPARTPTPTGPAAASLPHGTSTMTSSYGLPSNSNGAGSTGGTLAGENIWQPASAPRSRSTHGHTAGLQNGTGGGAGVGLGLGERLSDLMGSSRRKDSLPYYKDKPYAYPGKGRQGAAALPRWLQQRRTAAIAVSSLLLLAWWFGLFSSSPHPPTGTKTSTTVTTTSKTKSWFGGSAGDKIDWNQRAEHVKDAFKISFAGYEKYGWGYDEYHPVEHTGKYMTPKGLGWIIIDSLDTMMLMNLTDELTHARQWLHDLSYDQDHDVNTFETTIRMLGGLLSAHYLSTEFQGVFAPVEDSFGDDMYIEKAADLADRLLSAYETTSGVPLASVNLAQRKGIPSHADGGASSTAEATTVQLEMKYLAKLTGETHYWETAEQVMKVIDDNDSPDGLVPIFIYADQGTFRGSTIRLGSRGDSYYEYLIKQYLQTSGQEPIYQAMWNESLAGVKKHLITYSEPDNYTIIAERQNGLTSSLTPKMDHLVCFMPGTIALATTGGVSLAQAKAHPSWGPRQEEDLILAEELMKTCMGMYAVTPTGLAPEIAHFKLHNPVIMYNDFTSPATRPRAPEDFTDTAAHGNYEIHAGDVHNLQRPETVESLFYMWRITRNPKYRHWGWQIFQSFIEHTGTPDGEGFSSAKNVLQVPPGLRDNMESFWLAETLKYFYLLFREDDLLPLDTVVFNTEAHPFPRFELGKLFKTGWKRRSERSATELAQEAAAAEHQKRGGDTGPVLTQTRVVTQIEVRTMVGDESAAAPTEGTL